MAILIVAPGFWGFDDLRCEAQLSSSDGIVRSDKGSRRESGTFKRGWRSHASKNKSKKSRRRDWESKGTNTAMVNPADVLDRHTIREVEEAGGGRATQALMHLASSGVAYGEGRFKDAAREAALAKKFAPRSASIREALGVSLYACGEWKKALAELRTFERLSGSHAQCPLIADCLRATGRPEQALDHLEARISKDDPEPLRIEAELVRAALLKEAGRVREAIGALRRVLKQPKNVDIYHLRLWYMLAELFTMVGRDEEARMLFERIAEHDPTFLDAASRADIGQGCKTQRGSGGRTKC